MNDASLSKSKTFTIRMMPRDVATRWNSTYDMLVFALEYREAIDKISGDRDMRKYELSEEEWELIQQLCDVLVVRCAGCLRILVTHIFSDIQRCDPFLFTFDTEPCYCDTCNGSHRRASRHRKPKLAVLTGHSCVAGTRKSPSKQVLRHD
jgi:hypothetical protein